MTTNNEHAAESLRAPRTSALVRILALLLLLALVFWIGTAVGYRKAEFSYRFSDNYFQAFGGNRANLTMMGLNRQDALVSGRGTVGKVLNASLPTILVSDRDGTEKSVLITNETVVRSARMDIASSSIKADDFVVVIGSPDATGRIIATFVRVMPSSLHASSSLPYGGPGMMRTR